MQQNKFTVLDVQLKITRHTKNRNMWPIWVENQLIKINLELTMMLEFTDKDTKSSCFNFSPYVHEARRKIEQSK